MLVAIQLVTVLQGIFLLSVLFMKRNTYKKPALWLLLGAILSILFFVLGDDENNMLSKGVDWFFFDASLFVTFLFLFVKYYVSGNPIFKKGDALFFLPNLIYFANEVWEVTNPTTEVLPVEVMELCIELTFLVYLLLTIGILFSSKKQRWMLLFVIPLVILMSASIVNEVLGWFDLEEIEMFNDANFNTFTLITVAVLFYFITMKLIIAPTQVLLKEETLKYKSSGLNHAMVDSYKSKIISFMEDAEGYKDPQLSLSSLSEHLEIPKQYISEILNVHLKTNFQEFVNSYRVESFIDCMQNGQYEHLALIGIANEVGFNSKSSFYAVFKKHKGITPSEYKKSLLTSS